MIDVAILAALALVTWAVHLFMGWQGDRIHQQMLAGIQAALRSRIEGGSDVALDSAPQASAATRAGVQPPNVSMAPPALQASRKRQVGDRRA